MSEGRTSTRLTRRELEALNEALAHRLAGELEWEDDDDLRDGTDMPRREDYETAKEKIQTRLGWPGWPTQEKRRND